MWRDSASHCCRRVRAKAGGDRPHGIGGLLHRVETRRSCPDSRRCAAMACHWITGPTSLSTSRRTGTGNGSSRLPADQPCRSARPCWCRPSPASAGLQLRQQRQHVGRVGGNLVALRVLQPVASAAARPHPGTPPALPPRALAQGLRQHIEIAPLARQAMHANHHMAGVWRRPIASRPCGGRRWRPGTGT